MAGEQANDDRSPEQGSSIISAILSNGYLGGELDAAFRQGARELGSALKAFPDAIQVDEPGQVFNPLYRDRDGATPAHSSPSEIADQGMNRGSVHGEPQTGNSMSPSEIADQSASRGSVHGDAQANSQPSPSEIADNPQAASQEQYQGRSHGRGM
jgi:hypothetical protein